ncbi:MAG: quinone-dependent dihydroorotate dehydrogenase [Limnohabitans sp.]|nr:quinone-dependent dihydroorotate dehydrogenase [Limnohabitans sp.]
MSLIPYAFTRPFLFVMDPEEAHDQTLSLLAKTQNTPLQWSYCQSLINDPVTIAGLRFPNRLGLAAGLDKNARCIDAFSAMGFGFVEVGTVTPKAQPGNPKPRMFRLPEAQALINRLGFNNDGLDRFILNVQLAVCRKPAKKKSTLLGLNIGKNASTPIEQATDDYLIGLEGVYPHADYVTVNISSPNTHQLRSLQTDEALDSLIRALENKRQALQTQYQKHTPIFIKIAPDLDEIQIQSVSQTLLRHVDTSSTQSWGIIATNTTIDKQSVQHLQHAQETGGLSGSPVFEKSNRIIQQLRQTLGPQIPIIGVGGILSGSDAVEKIKAGADLVQIYTGLIYKGPTLITECALSIQKYFQSNR